MSRVRCLFPRNSSEQKEEGVIPFLMDLSGSFGGSCHGTLRRSPRAKKVRLIVDRRGLTVVTPRRFRVTKDLEPLLDLHLEWILRSLGKIKNCLQPRPSLAAPLPGRIVLPALEEVWRVELADDSGRVMAVAAPDGGGIVRLPKNFTQLEAIAALRGWLRLRAKLTLPPWFLSLATAYLPSQPINHITVKDLRSRWGSCSSRHNINLNCRLLFLPPDLVRHVMLHELCHLIEMNHSAAFYDNLRVMDVETDRHIEELRSAWGRVPAWASES